MRNLVRLQTAQRLRKLDLELRHVAHDLEDADAIHDLRVSIRRLRQELRVFEEWFDKAQVKSVRGRLRKLLDRCAAVRNCDVAIDVLRAAGFRDRAVIAALDEERRHMRAALGRMLEAWRRRNRVRKWRGDLRVGRVPGEAGEITRGLLSTMTKELFRAGREAARPRSTHRTMHQFRLKVKRMRYTLELFEREFGGKIKKIMDALKGLQEKLGAINDCATTLEMVGANRRAAAAVRRLALKRETEFREYWKAHFRPRKRSQWIAVLGAADRKK